MMFAVANIVTVFLGCRKDNTISNSSSPSPRVISPDKIFPKHFGMPKLPADNPFTEEGVYLGRMLFYDPMLSLDSTISCNSCHRQENAFADPRKVSIGINGLKTTRNASPLFNLAYNNVFFWDGRQLTLRDLFFEPIQAHNEMALPLAQLEIRLRRNPKYIHQFRKAFGTEPTLNNAAKAMEQFLLQLVSKDSKFDLLFVNNRNFDAAGFTQDEKEGFFIFNAVANFDGPRPNNGAECFHCHGGVLAQQNNIQQGALSNNGLDSVIKDAGRGAITGKSYDIGLFKAPSLRNILYSGAFMHDGRFSTIDEVIQHYNTQIKFNSPNLSGNINHHKDANGNFKQLNLNATQVAQLKAFLLTMQDETFINNPAYKNPF